MSEINQELYQRSLKVAPGGVHSPVRSFKGLPMAPRFFTKGQGAYIEDVEGKNYIDFCMSFGPLILGHAPAVVAQGLHQGLEKGWSFGACEPYSLELAEFLLKEIPFIEKIRFVNSGTEAVMTALRLARGFTKKDKIIKFNGCYHGHLDSMLIKAGSGLAGESCSSSAGVPENVAKDTLIVELNDEKALKECFDQHPGQIAAVIIEPLPANNGLLIQRPEFLRALRAMCTQHQALLIFDEVISGFRVGTQGMAQILNIDVDLVTYGKVIGGGLPVGAVAGKKDIMDMIAPLGPVYQAGTLSANPLAMQAGLTTLKNCTSKTYQEIEHYAQEITELFNRWLNKHYPDSKVISYSSLFWITSKEVKEARSIGDIPADQGQRFTPVFSDLLERGIYLAPNAYEVGFVSHAHGPKVIQDLKARLKL